MGCHSCSRADARSSTLLNRDEAFVKMMLDYGLDVNTRDNWFSWTALDHVAAQGTIGSFKVLMHHGADLSRANPLHAAAGSENAAGRKEMLVYLLDDVKLDINAISTLEKRIVRLGCENGTPMHAAINAEKSVNVRFLLERGADLTVKNEKGVDAWTLAESNATSLVHILESTGLKRPVAARHG